MSGTKPVVIAWDSCVFLGWFNAEEDKPLLAMEAILKAVADGDVTLLVSAICGAEVLNEAGKSDARSEFLGFLKRDNVVPANVDMRIADKAAQFRERTREALAQGHLSKGIRAPDALIAATAVIYRASALHTFDPQLLALSGTEYVDRLVICSPSMPTGQKTLDS